LRVGERHACSVPRARDQPACAPSGDYLRSPGMTPRRYGPLAYVRSPPPPADLAGRWNEVAALNLLSTAKLNIARSRLRPSSWSLSRIVHTPSDSRDVFDRSGVPCSTACVCRTSRRIFLQ
jgi:hypothetical protein